MPIHEGFPVEPRSRLKIRSVAVNARSVLEIPDGRINIAGLLDRLTLFGIYYDVFDRYSVPVPAEVEACYMYEDRTLYIRDSIYDEMESGGQRAVFTFGHELGHAVLGHRPTFNRQSVATVPIYSRSEWQADTFSAEFTMPLEQIRRLHLYTPDAISRFFGVSNAAARVRFDELRKKGEV